MIRLINKEIITIIFFLFSLPVLAIQADDVHITSQSDQGITLVFRPQNWQIVSQAIENQSYIKINFQNSDFAFSPGDPRLPVRTVIVGIPFGVSINLEIIEKKESRTVRGRVMPLPQLGHQTMGDFKFLENKQIYHSLQPFPPQLADISASKVVRHQRVAVLSFYPAIFEPAIEKIHLYDQLTVRINFSQAGFQHDSMNSDRDKFSYHSMLINAEFAKRWRQTPPRLAKRSSEQLTGDFYKIFISEDGMYKITGADLQNAGLSLRNVNPATIKILNNGGLPLPQDLDQSRSVDLIENAIFVDDGGDGRFDLTDYLLFYGKAVNGWQYHADRDCYYHYLHPYTRENIYWLSWQDLNPGKRMETKASVVDSSAIPVDEFLDHLYLENEFNNLLNSGTCWLGNYFSDEARQRTYQLNLKDAIPGRTANFRLTVAGISNHLHRFLCYCNDVYFAKVPDFYSSSVEHLAIVEKSISSAITSGIENGNNRIKIEYQPVNSASLAYLDWLELDYYRQLKADNNELEFYSPDSAGVYHYSIHSFSGNDIRIFDISQFANVSQIKSNSANNGKVEFFDTVASQTAKKYLAIHPDKFKKTLNIQKDIASNWRGWEKGADLIIITYDDFYDAVLPLKSFRENCDSLKTVIVNISDVYDEFAWGLKDPTAIRDFIKYAYENWSPSPRFVLLCGDGDFDYKNYLSPQDPNWIPPYETSELSENSSRARDDWYVCVAGDDDFLDLAIGRIPVRSFDQALQVVKKIIDYQNDPAMGEWSNTFTMVADDEFGQGGAFDQIQDHIPDAEKICETVIPSQFDIKKIYLTEYPIEKSASISGIRKPAATEAFLKQINKGSLIINYIGHGNEDLLAHERVINKADDFSKIENGARQALWIAATCEFGRWDNPAHQSFAEELLNAEGCGAIAVITSGRDAFPDYSVRLNEKFYQCLFSGRESVRVGEALMMAKNLCGNTVNDQIYHLIGDPSLSLFAPHLQVKVKNFFPDSMSALSKIQVSGQVKNPSDSTSLCKGKVMFSAYDSRKQRHYHVRDNQYYFYKLPGNCLFRGTVSVDRNIFNSQFIVPKDISYGGTEGRFSLFYWDDKSTGAGYVDNILVAGTQQTYDDHDGPIITIGFTDQDFFSGAYVTPNSDIIIKLEDKISGINIAGDIGHKITMMLDGDEAAKLELTEFFSYDQDSYTSGKVRYPLHDIAEGDHKVSIKAWDNCNNSSQAETNFTIVSNDQIVIRDLLNYPNPFSHETEIAFWINQPCEVDIKIFTLSGRLIRKIADLQAEPGFNHFWWDGLDQDGETLANDIYLYKVSANCFNGTRHLIKHEIQKCAKVR